MTIYLQNAEDTDLDRNFKKFAFWLLGPVSERVAINRKLRLIASSTQFAIELRLISIVRLIANLCETGPWKTNSVLLSQNALQYTLNADCTLFSYKYWLQAWQHVSIIFTEYQKGSQLKMLQIVSFSAQVLAFKGHIHSSLLSLAGI